MNDENDEDNNNEEFNDENDSGYGTLLCIFLFKANLAARIGPFGLVGLKYGLWFLGCGERWKQRNNTEKNLESRNLPKNLFFFLIFLQF